MFNPIEILINNFVKELQEGYKKTYGGLHQEYSEIICWAANMALVKHTNYFFLFSFRKLYLEPMPCIIMSNIPYLCTKMIFYSYEHVIEHLLDKKFYEENIYVKEV
jgi:hypothetical protein